LAFSITSIGEEDEEARDIQPEEAKSVEPLITDEPAAGPDDSSDAVAKEPDAVAEGPDAAGEASDEVTKADDGRFSWYAVHTYSGFEKSVMKALTFLSETQKELEDKIARIYVPTEQVKSRRADGREMKRERPLFPGYVFLQLELTPDVERLCSEAPKVIGFVKSGNDLQSFTDEEIAAIEAGKEERRQAGARDVPFSVGDRVRIVEGLFAPFSGAVEDVSADKKRLKVTVGIFGRPIPVELAFDQVELSDEED